jgi:ribosomal protein S18 acetylase RimI-like enzyme
LSRPHAPESFDPNLLSRVEDAGLNASAPPQQRWVDGWLLRFSAGKAKRARCINAVATGRLAFDAKLAYCTAVLRGAGLPLMVRITPFSQPLSLDDDLAALGLHSIDDTRVMVNTSLAGFGAAASPERHRFVSLDAVAFAELVGGWQGSSAEARRAQAERLALSPVAFHSIALMDAGGAPVACGQLALEADIAGLYGVHTAAEARGRGLGEATCRELLRLARERGATTAYLQVDAANEVARRLYWKLGFTDGYAYHYRTDEPMSP